MAFETAFLVKARVTETYLEVELSDGRRLATPMTWYPALQKASRDERDAIEVQPWGVHWPLIDEDLSLEGMLAGRPGVEPNAVVPDQT